MNRSPLAGKKRKNPPEHPPRQPMPSKTKRDNRPRTLKDTTSGFQQVEVSLDITLPPMFIEKPQIGTQEMLDSMLMQYIPALQGVLLSHSNLAFTSDTALILPDSPFARCTVSFKALVWSPRVGMKLKGRINLSSPDHISLLVHRTFNVSILRQHLPFEGYEFEYGPAENDPEFGVGTANEASYPRPEAAGEEQEVRDPGRWVHRRTGVPLGGVERTIEFTIIGLTIANGMLSLLGSTLPDPFASNLKQAPPQSVNRKTRHEKEAGWQDEDHDHDAGGNAHLEEDGPFAHPGEGTERSIENRSADVDVGPTFDSVRTQSDKKAEKKRKRREKTEPAVEGPPVKRKRKERTQS